MKTIDIKGLDKVDILMKLYSASKPQGMGFFQPWHKELTRNDAIKLLSEGPYFDYLYGRVLKIDLSGDTLNTVLYDRDNGPGAAARALGVVEQQ